MAVDKSDGIVSATGEALESLWNRSAEDSPPERVAPPRGALDLVKLFVAPTTLVGSLAFYFGWTFTNARSNFFDIDPSLLGYSTQDYVLRSAQALFVPLGAVILLSLAAVTLNGLVARNLVKPDRTGLLRVCAWTAVALGGPLFALGVYGVFEPTSLSLGYLFPPASPGLGIAALAFGIHIIGRLRRPSARPVAAAGINVHVALVGAVVVLSAFWTASVYANALGRGKAIELAANLASRPEVTVFSAHRLFLGGPGVSEQALASRDSAYGYRYSGMRLLVHSGGRYFLLPDDWSRTAGNVAGNAIVLADGPTLRFEFGR